MVLLPAGQKFAGMPDRLQPLVTQWGLDPLWDTVLPKEQVRATDFPARVIDEEVELQEIEGQRAHVVGHRVHWHADRKLWYCDIELDPGRSYMPFVRLALVRYQPNALPEVTAPVKRASAKVSKVVLTDFAQVLPRRRAKLTRNANAISLALHGAMPTHGPMKWQLTEQPYTNISTSFPGNNPETGRSRAELVLQFRDAAIDSDLAWSDAAVLASSIVPQPSGGSTGPLQPIQPLQPLRPSAIFDPGAVTTVQNRLGHSIDLERVVELGGALASAARVPGAPGPVTGPTTGPIVTPTQPGGVVVLPDLFDPIVWQATATLPSITGKVARLALREFERYYTDRTVPEKVGTATWRRRVTEERLVFTTFFDL